ncbi:hypothetical protein PR048_032757 [Dryococelus australis]|uniref:Uncharacterized protein n=1 Tax=Dryococelus australis TaxID=614101 RepID=A0ABQ9G348_9NEOP|nr:hypothetical protein PR048_032757 [Dryococelus australis]
MRCRRRIPMEVSSKPSKGCTFVHEISSTSGTYQVCETDFCNIRAITEDKSPHDKRGKSVPGNTKPRLVIDAIKQDISSFPVNISHYSGKEYHYLGKKLDVKTMYSFFQTKYPEMSAANYRFYLKVFKEHEGNLVCYHEELDVNLRSPFLNQTSKKVAGAEKRVHLHRAKKLAAKMKEISDVVKADSTGDLGAICIDNMQNSRLPCIPVQGVYYLRQLTISVYCILNPKNGKANSLRIL